MTEFQVERAAEEALTAHGLAALPVDPFGLARLEHIRVAPGRYGGSFDGRIEFRGSPEDGDFYLFYEEAAPPRRPASRVRFSVAHELGHYFLPAHRDYLVSGQWHGTHARLLRSHRVEREADWFAAALLMPRRRFVEQARHRAADFCTLADLAVLADRVFCTSLTSTVLRYVQLNFAPCGVLLSDRERVIFATRSDCLRLAVPGGADHIPARSLTGRLRADERRCRPMWCRGFIDAGIWFDGLGRRAVWEDVKVLGRTGRILTYLALPTTMSSGSGR